MADLRITNCHIHTFTMSHVPRNYPARWLRFLRLRPEIAVWLGRTMGRLFGRAHPEGFWPRIERLGRFGVIGKLGSQEAVLQSILSQYSAGTRFVVLPMDMAPIGHGPVAADLPAQHDELSRLARSDRFAGQIIPFATLHPARDGAFGELRRAVETLGFRGLKLYPKLGFEPTDPLLMDRVYPYCLDHDLPVMAHCSRGGVAARGWEGWRGERACDPQA